MIIKRIPAGIYDANCYIVMDEDTKDTVVLDIGGDEEYIIRQLKALGGNLKAILLTHGHIDHVAGVSNFNKTYNVPVYIAKEDEDKMKNNDAIFGSIGSYENVHHVKDGEILTFGSLKFKVIKTPGHTPGGVCYLMGDSVFTGDTLFLGSIGRTDFDGGSHSQLINSIVNKLMVLDDNTKVLCGHGPETSIGRERVSNPFF